jgi:hypothetical protein
VRRCPGTNPAREPSEAETDRLQAQAFRDLEGRIGDCVIMASIAVQIAEYAIEGRSATAEKAMFAVFHVAEMLKKLNKDYLAVYEGKNAVGPEQS